MQEPRAGGSQEEPKVPWNDSQDELFAVLYAQAFAEVQGKTNGDKMGELLAAYVNEHSASLGGRKMTPAQALHRAAYAKAGCAAVWKWSGGCSLVLPALPGIQAVKVWVLPIGPMGPPQRQQLMQRLQGGARTQARRLQVTAISA
ncbi:hypothetical protein QJQ45_017260 [Haematococcus lacustris]|nr:hypothetical protein QJQ45_017260 [Haematococcus lacustris]